MRTITAENKYKIYVDDTKNMERLIVCEENGLYVGWDPDVRREPRLRHSAYVDAKIVITDRRDSFSDRGTLTDAHLPAYIRFTNGEYYRICKNFVVQKITKKDFDKLAGFNQWTPLIRAMQAAGARFLIGDDATYVMTNSVNIAKVGCRTVFHQLLDNAIINQDGYVVGKPNRDFYRMIEDNQRDAIGIGRDLGIMFGLIKEHS